MSMGSGAGTRNAVAEINVTPLIDVLLVLLIIFMVIVPVTPKGLGALIPQPPKIASTTPPETTIVVSVLANAGAEPSYKINDTVFPKAQVEAKLAEIFRTRQEKTMFIAASAGLEFSQVAEVIDMGHQASVDNIALMASIH
jgi:biopolymer transport protein TolR